MEVKTLKELGKNLTVLYIEDEGMIRQQMEDILKNLFKSVHTATDGQEGVELFQKHDFDIVITDIQMPRKNGLEAAREIKTISPQTPIVVTTAYSDINLFITSIEIGIDRYVLKPIGVPNLFGSLQAVCEGINNRKKAEELNRKKLLEEINEISSDIAQKLADAFPNPSIAISGQKLKFVNEAFVELMGEANLKTLQTSCKNLDNFFEQKDGFIWSLDEINEADYTPNKVILNINGKKNIYLIAKRKIAILSEQIDIYTLSNITRIEYQKRKNQNYAELLQEILFTRYKTAKIPLEQKPSSKENREYLYLSQEEKDILRKTHNKKYTALEYIGELDENLVDELDEFGELENEWKELLGDFEESANWVAIEKISTIIQKYSKTISSLIEFEDLSYALSSLARVLTDAQPSEANRTILLILLEAMKADLCDWREKIFVQKSAKDIHYLDSSLFSSCLQLQLKLGAANGAMDDGELELF